MDWSVVRRLLVRSPLAYELRKHLDFAPALIAGKTAGAKRRWSQDGEDAFLAEHLRPYINDGFFVDVGANHPSKLSNTYRLYCMGMRGILVEPDAALCRVLRTWRPDDVVVRSAISERDGIMPFYYMYPHVFSTLSEEVCKQYVKGGMVLLRKELMLTFRLQTIVDAAKPAGRSVFALLSVDAEGVDDIVLRSNDWIRNRPILTVVEQNTSEAARGIHDFMASVNYAPAAKFGVNTVFRSCDC